MKLLEPVLFRDGRPVSRLSWKDAHDTGIAIDAHTGHFAIHERDDDGNHLLVRDLLGVHKLFYTVDDEKIESSSYLVDLLRAGHPFESVFSVPAGHYVRVNPEERRYELARWGRIPFGPQPGEPGPQRTLAHYATSIRTALERTFRMIAQRVAGHAVYVTLSGGLDSTAIAALAAEYFEDPCALTFALRNPRESGPGADLFSARRVASDLGIAHGEVLAEPEEILGLLDDVLVYGQDYRDFNVHCGLVNAAIGKAVGALHTRGPRPVILSGDSMNELLADYAPVRYQGREYFGLPSLDRGRIRRFLVNGLDSGDREAGIFAHFGVDAVQPYALCAREYAALPSELACDPGSKSRLVRAVMGGRVPEYVHARPKVRAQVAVEGEPGGTTALLVDNGIDQEHLRRRFARLLGIEPRAVRNLTRAGFYRFSTRFPATLAHGVLA